MTLFIVKKWHGELKTKKHIHSELAYVETKKLDTFEEMIPKADLVSNLAPDKQHTDVVNKVVPLNKLEETVLEWCSVMQQKSPLALRMIKRCLNAELDGQHGLMQLAGDATLLYYLTEEAQEGKNAFLEKRKPDFKKYPKFP